MTPVMAEETRNPRDNLPKGMTRGIIFTTLVLLVKTTIGAFSPPGVNGIMFYSCPMTGALNSIYKVTNQAFNWLEVPTYLAALESTAFAQGRVIYSLARAGLLPKHLTRWVGTIVFMGSVRKKDCCSNWLTDRDPNLIRTLPGSITRLNKDGAPKYALMGGGFWSFVASLLLLADWKGQQTIGFFHKFFLDLSMVAGAIHITFIFGAFLMLRYRCKNVRASTDFRLRMGVVQIN